MFHNRSTKNLTNKPDYIVPLVLYLCHQDTTETGGVFEVGAGWVSKVRLQRSAGVYMKDLTPEKIKDNWAQIESFDNPSYPTSASESVSGILAAVNNKPADGESVLVRPPKVAVPKALAATPSGSVVVDGYNASKIFTTIQGNIGAKGAELVKKINGIYLINIKKGTNTQAWALDLKNGSGSIVVGAGSTKPNVTITVSDEDFVDIMTGKLNAQSAFTKGKLKISGNMGLATKLGALMQGSKL
ncbi:hypothetical protein ACTFIW_003024 [Dictyostelium discoideum]